MRGRLTGPIKHVFSRDPALDRDAPKFEELLKTANESGELAGLPLKEGRRPWVWTLSSLSDRAYMEFTRLVADEALSHLRRVLARGGVQAVLVERATYPEAHDAFRRGVLAVSDLVDVDGSSLKLEHEDTPAGKVITSACMDKLQALLGPKVIGEIGLAVIEASELDPT